MLGRVLLLAMLAVTAQAQLLFESSEGGTKERSGCIDWSILSDSELIEELKKGVIIEDIGNFICETNTRNQRRNCRRYEECIGSNYIFQYLGHTPKYNFRFEHTGGGELAFACPNCKLTGTGEQLTETEILRLLKGGVLTKGCNSRVPGV